MKENTFLPAQSEMVNPNARHTPMHFADRFLAKVPNCGAWVLFSGMQTCKTHKKTPVNPPILIAGGPGVI